ncbi:MAG: ABC transporter ATP-binding protein [Actinomycetota bacterium]
MADIRLEGLHKEFDEGSVVAVRDLNLTFKDGTTTCLLGPSGCGKTTLMRIIAGLEHPSRGQVFFDDVDVTDLKTRDRDIGMVFQYPVVYRGASVRENIALPLRGEDLSQAEKDARVDELLALIDLEDAADLEVTSLDSGTRQKVAVARAVSRHAPIILFDEPITNVDPDMKLQMKRTLRALFTRLNQTIIYVTHDQTEAMTLADEIALMSDGAIDQMAPPRELYNDSATRFSGWFLGNPGMVFVSVDENREVAQALVGHVLPEATATIGFRPEHVRVTSDRTGTGVGATVKHAAVVTGGQVLTSLETGSLVVKAKLPWDALSSVRPGGEVKWSVDVSRIRLFDENDRAVPFSPAEN